MNLASLFTINILTQVIRDSSFNIFGLVINHEDKMYTIIFKNIIFKNNMLRHVKADFIYNSELFPDFS